MDGSFSWFSGPEWLRAAGHVWVSFRSVTLGASTENAGREGGGGGAAGMLGANVCWTHFVTHVASPEIKHGC